MKPDSTDTAANAARPLPLVGEPAALAGYGADEFPEGAAEFNDEPSRRRFMTIMGASIALAGAAGCNVRPAAQRKITPYTTQPDEVTLGNPLYFATAFPMAGHGQGILVRSNEGRPTKVEGNPDAPGSLGGVGVFAQASLLDLYDPDRSRTVTQRGLPATYEGAVQALRAKLYNETAPKKEVRLRLVTETVTSPTLLGLVAQLLSDFPAARWVPYEPVTAEAARAGNAKALGKPANVTYDFNKADVVLSLDSDFLCSGPGATRYQRDFADRRKIRQDGKTAEEVAAGRKPGQPFKEGVKFDLAAPAERSPVNRLYVVETMATNTGGVADHRLALTNAQVESFARALAAELGVAGAPAAGALPDHAKAWLKPLAADLNAKKGKVVVVAGDHHPASLHALAMAINSHLGALGQTVHAGPALEGNVPGKTTDLKTLVAEMNAKAVDVLLILGGATNPAYSAPADLKFADALKAMGEDKAKLTFHLGTHQDETSVLCEWHVPEAHYLETWGDVRDYDGTVLLQQPLIAPLYDGKPAIQLLAALGKGPEAGVPGAPRDPLEIVQATWRGWFNKQKKGGTFEVFWNEAVRKGVIDGTTPAAEKPTLAGDWAVGAPAASPDVPKGQYEINFRADPTIYDGRFANNGWLQEMPKPLLRMSWDNAAYMSRRTAVELGVKVRFPWTGGEHGRAEVTVIDLEVNGKKVKAPAWILPDHADGAITVHLGYGRSRAGRVGNAEGATNLNAAGEQTRGFDAYPLRTSVAPWAAPGKATRTDATYFLACVQGHWSMVEKDPVSGKFLDRKPIRHGSTEDYKKNPRFAKIPPMAIGETDLINENVPQPVQPGQPVPGAHPPAERKAGEQVPGEQPPGGHESSPRLTPLNMYAPMEGLSPDLNDAQRRRWAMAIDLSACTGCSACVTACQSENNTPVVGKEQVTKGREMYWINIDRYYDDPEGDPNAIHVYFQPRLCAQCENAPCEVVCPVGATVHSVDGLNDMVYNRCVGTRYCSNNCPYKVRRFNFLTFQDWETDTIKLGRNPDVSVRSRGVMEKCTFCVQRIRTAEIIAERELARGDRKLPDYSKGESLIKDGEILTACQAACPSGAIVFGNINDADARVSKWKNEPANYGLLAELNTRPRLTYTAVVRNPNPAMPGAKPAEAKSH
jgi:molybdopterin-containing oxidoreductase family iron-sulfur binding subunit